MSVVKWFVYTLIPVAVFVAGALVAVAAAAAVLQQRLNGGETRGR